jgi:hypothetical protein
VLLRPAAVTTAEDKPERDAGGCTEAVVEVAEEPVLKLVAATQSSSSWVRSVIPRSDVLSQVECIQLMEVVWAQRQEGVLGSFGKAPRILYTLVTLHPE